MNQEMGLWILGLYNSTNNLGWIIRLCGTVPCIVGLSAPNFQESDIHVPKALLYIEITGYTSHASTWRLAEATV